MSKKNIIAAINNGKAAPPVKLIRDDPQIPAILSKLMLPSDRTPSYDSKGNREITTTTATDFLGISNDIANKTRDAETIVELFPDMELSAQILISSIISPKDMTGTEINFTLPPGLKVSEAGAALIAELKDYITKSYKIEPLLPVILRRCLFESGSYPVAVIPEASIDAIINSQVISKESINDVLSPLTTKDSRSFKAIGLLGPKEEQKSISTIRAGLESITGTGLHSLDNYDNTVTHLSIFNGLAKAFENVDKNLVITDNYSILKLPYVFEKLREKSVLSIVNKASNKTTSAFESFDKITDSSLTRMIYKNPVRNSSNIIKVKTTNEVSRETIGEPLVMHLPSEAVIPVFTPGNEENHVGYFVLLDMEGNPVSRSNMETSYSDLQRRLNNQNTNMSSAMLQRAKGMFGEDCTGVNFQQASQIYADIIEADLLARLRNGVYGKTLSIGRNEEIYRLMLARAFKAQFTQLLFVPAELMTYYAIKYDNRGIGKSLNDDLRVLNSIRAMVLFTKLAAQIKNSIGRTEVSLELDPEDPNPQGTIERAIHEIVRTRQHNLPLGTTAPGDLSDWVQRAGLQFSFTNHPSLPEMKINFNEVNSNYVVPENDLEEDLRKRAIMAVGLNPETVDNGFSAEFATTIVNNNLLLNKRVSQIQEKILPLVTDNIRKVVSNDGDILGKLKDIIENNLDKIAPNIKDITITDENKQPIIDLLLNEFLSNFESTLPRPSSITLENQMESYDTYVDSLDKVLNNFINASVLPKTLVGDELNQKMDEMKEVVKAAYIRRFMQENNIFPELFEMITYDDKGQPVFNLEDIQKNFNDDVSKGILKLFRRAKPIADAADKDMQNLGVADLDSTSISSSSSSSDSDTGSEGGSGGDDFGLDSGSDDFGLPGL